MRTSLVYFLGVLLTWMCLPTLLLFALYFAGHRVIDDRFEKWSLRFWLTEAPWFIFVGLPTGVMNVVWNFLSSLIFLRLPVWRNESGELSPFFTTRMKAYRKEGYAPVMVNFYISLVNYFDPGHFD